HRRRLAGTAAWVGDTFGDASLAADASGIPADPCGIVIASRMRRVPADIAGMRIEREQSTSLFGIEREEGPQRWLRTGCGCLRRNDSRIRQSDVYGLAIARRAPLHTADPAAMSDALLPQDPAVGVRVDGM